MVSDIFSRDDILYKDDTHQYFNYNGEEYTSVSRLLSMLTVPFDAQSISRRMVSSLDKSDQDNAQKELLKQWEDNRDDASEWGTYIHSGIEKFTKEGIVQKDLEKAINGVASLLKDYYRFYPETILHSHHHKVAGTTDNVAQRQKSVNSLFDFFDYKTNKSRGIQYDSISRTSVPYKHYNKRFLPPLDYLEYCNYVYYALQLSIYAYMAHTRNNIQVGRLGIIFIDQQQNVELIPVPFMLHEAEIICEMNLRKKPLSKIKTDDIQFEW